ncbi:hypothetical protein FQN54_005917 [Arachnomyces sp. PD_36]|nr:hypothetical protein FQN54_005917 [Arachnomyces sp. PD_36]
MATTILDYLTRENPVLNTDNSLEGSVTRNSDWPMVPGVKVWNDFTFDTLMSCYGEALQHQFPGPFSDISPRLTDLECEIWDEDSLEHLLSRSIIPSVSAGLTSGWDLCYPSCPNRVDITRGGRAKHSNDNDDDNDNDGNGDGSGKGKQISVRIKESEEKSATAKTAKSYPDWAGVSKKDGQQGYTNRCPGDTKLSTKWESSGRRNEEFFRPISQILS